MIFKLLIFFIFLFTSNLLAENISKNNYDENKILKEAKKLDKNILVFVTRDGCRFCEIMRKKVFSKTDVKNIMDNNFILLEVNIDHALLPFGLSKDFQGMTPTFYFISKNKKILNRYLGAWRKKDFIFILNENIKK
jgi:thioredoxin-related protein